MRRAGRATLLGLMLVAVPGAASSAAVPRLANRGFVVEWLGGVERSGRYEVDGAEVPEAACRAARNRCRELVVVGWTVLKQQPSDFDQAFPLLCSTLTVSRGFELRGKPEVCDRFGVRGVAEHSLMVAGAAGVTGGRLDVALRVERRAESAGKVLPVGVLEGSWPMPAGLRGRGRAGGGGLLAWVLGPTLGVGSAVLGWALWRRKRGRRTQAGESLSPGEPPGPSLAEAGDPETLPAVPAPLPAGPPLVPAAIRLEVAPVELPPDGRSLARAVARVTAADGVPVAGLGVSFLVEGGAVGGALARSSAVTDGEGCARLEVSAPLLVEGRRIYVRAEVAASGSEQETLRARQWIRIRDVALEVRPDRARLAAGGGEWVWLEAHLRDDAGQSLAEIELRASVVDAAGGPLEPDTAVTNEEGRAEFAYTAGPRPAEVRVRIWPEGEPRLAVEVVVEQVGAEG